VVETNEHISMHVEVTRTTVAPQIQPVRQQGMHAQHLHISPRKRSPGYAHRFLVDKVVWRLKSTREDEAVVQSIVHADEVADAHFLVISELLGEGGLVAPGQATAGEHLAAAWRRIATWATRQRALSRHNLPSLHVHVAYEYAPVWRWSM